MDTRKTGMTTLMIITCFDCKLVSDSNISFDGICQLLRNLGFDERIRGSHHIFTKNGIEEILNLQPSGSHAKAYQMKQIRNVMIKYKLAGDQND